MMKTTKFVKQSDVHKKWVLIDASGQSIGRVATIAATILRGKDKPYFTPNADIGDNVVIINANKVKVTGKKMTQEFYYRHSGYTGNIKSFMMRDVLQSNPEFAIEHAVRLMLPKNRLGRKIFKNLRVYKNSNYPENLLIDRKVKVSGEG